MYRFIGIILMIAGTIALVILGAILLLWAEIIRVPKRKSIEIEAELVPTKG